MKRRTGWSFSFRLTALVFLFTLSVSADSRAQSSDSLTKGQIFVNDLKESWDDAGVYITQPLRWHGSDWAMFAGTAAGTTALMQWADQPMRDMVARNHSVLADGFSTFGNFFGSGGIGGVAAVALYTTGLINGDSHVRLMGRHIVQSLAYSGILTTSLKILFGRARPYKNLGPHDFVGVTYHNDFNALPSGHTTVSAAICSSLAEDIGNTWVSIGLYAIVGTTMFGRIYSDNHWLSDTFLGGVIGTTAGYFTVHAHDRKPGETGFYIQPGLNSLSLVYNF